MHIYVTKAAKSTFKKRERIKNGKDQTILIQQNLHIITKGYLSINYSNNPISR
uniref:Uncharacterized protein n=1 Tax=Rhizophora mucronata TaxID=61149 RepID=A0A2P2N8D6_RHIMU